MNNIATITEVWIPYSNALAFKTKWGLYNIRYARDDNGYEMFEASWQSHRNGSPVKNNRYPRWKLVARLASLPTLHEGGRVPLMDDMGNFPKMSKRKYAHAAYASR
jgi:hypothetical protein